MVETTTTTTSTDEGGFPPKEEKSTLVKQAEMWLRIDSIIHKASQLFNEWKAKMAEQEHQAKDLVIDTDSDEVGVSHPSPHVNINRNVNRFTLPKDPRELVIAVILALSILVNVALYVELRNVKQTVDLDRYDDNTFINGRFADLAAQVKSDHDLIQAYGLQKAVKER